MLVVFSSAVGPTKSKTCDTWQTSSALAPPLLLSSHRGSAGCVRQLLAAGASVDARNARGLGTAHLAVNAACHAPAGDETTAAYEAVLRCVAAAGASLARPSPPPPPTPLLCMRVPMEKPPPVSRMKSWSAFTPHYAEDVTYSLKALQGVAEEDATLHRLLISLFPDEWENFCERMVILPRMHSSDLPPHKVDGLCRWASDRAQVLSRTVRGMLRYADGLRVLSRLEGVPEAS